MEGIDGGDGVSATAADGPAASDARYRLIFNQSPVPMWVFDTHTLQFLAVNNSAVALYGYSRDEFLAMTVTELRAPEDRPGFLEMHERVRAGRLARNIGVVRHCTKDGRPLDMDITSDGIVYDGHEARLIVAIDVTAEHKASERLRASEAELRAMFGAMTDVVLVLDRDCHFLKIAPTNPALLFRPPTDLLGKRANEIFPEGLAGAFEAAVARAIETREPAHLDYSLDIRGEPRWFAGTASPMPGADQVVWVARDVTAERDAVAALRSREEELRQAQKLEAIGQLAGGLAHDFNNLLTVIASYAQLILAEAEDGRLTVPAVTADVAEIAKAADRGARLTRQLLAFSRKQVLQPRLLDVNDVINSAVALLRAAAGVGVTVTTELDPESAMVRADPGQLEQVLMNLVVNARDAMAEGGAIHIRTRTLAGRVELSVGDTGHGMTPEVRERIFDPFFTTKETGRGTGLGLATVYGIVTQSGGEIAVATEPGAGSTFTIGLPRVARDGAPATTASAVVADGRRATVLVVDDEPAVRAPLRRVLEQAGYDVLEAADGITALAVWDEASGAVDAVLTDFAMPNMDGHELARQLRERSANLPVVLMSGYTGALRASARREVPTWASAFVEKPFTRETVVAAVRGVLGR